ncbi:Beta-Ig-H3/fasciclin [Trichormus variabilis ATCC 29413]|uniref:Beta-Ig-H3/fasciclin n=2 Tax=Anabaena variabilis TaxID=264691 RepID=Q3MBV6_TRIV2|nr:MULTISPECIES: fasciclin domain-containing protein [Nostocaceae]ABA21530.1 Beta-Ig-H3/fasciclin [Trichormus variabilis ATCC 29413]MBC1213890.1 fasciclin domain-containing protein [Trichormus variabilis ARAD]MBC1258384.1 fasciclin domain-containing protein [Trichormus variabilis V5]MBC1266011.1 fasciclin domain-containing protein [Trichormus variabilis FSR]MBC1302040.1 fasciclin domain-containing protein [Trichormus variabilis N2B]
MRVNQNKLLTNLVGVVTLAGASLSITLPSGAREVLNPNPTIFQEAHYNRGQRIQANVNQITKDNSKKQVAQNTGRTNPRPSIFNEPPYNRGSRTSPTPVTPPETQPTTETPTTQPPAAETTNTDSKNLLALVQSNNSFTTLNKALQAAGLTETLQGKDNLTIFAPTDAAFAKLPQDALQALLQPDNKEVLLKVLTYHVVPGNVLSTDLKSGEVKSVEGGTINVKVDKQGVSVNDAKVIQADIKASNGVIHAIDTVILPADL